MAATQELSTEEKIKQSAKIVFTKKGFLAATVRDIAAEANTNVAAVNYHFRSKEKLFELIMAENMQQIFEKIVPVLEDATTTLHEKIEIAVSFYIDQILEDPDLPLFVVNEVMAGSVKLPIISNLKTLMNSTFAQQMKALRTDDKIGFHPIHLLMNIAGLIVFPFVSRHQIMKSGAFDNEAFIQLMQERKKLIPVWVRSMIG